MDAPASGIGAVPEITVTKIEAAQRQLRTAIELWFSDRDPISAHALAFAAHQVVHDLLRREKRTPQLAFELSDIKPEYRTEITKRLKEAAYFMKHAERGKAGQMASISFDTELTGVFIIYTMSGLRYFDQEITAEEQAFNLWHVIHKPHLMSDAGKGYLKDGDWIKLRKMLGTMPQQEFFQYACDAFRTHRSHLRHGDHHG